MTDETTAQKQIREYIFDNFLLGDEDVEFDNTQSFLETGLIDSTGILELIGFLEDTYGIAIEDEEMIPENLDSVERAARFVVGKK